jgi:hypothetical protein
MKSEDARSAIFRNWAGDKTTTAVSFGAGGVSPHKSTKNVREKRKTGRMQRNIFIGV